MGLSSDKDMLWHIQTVHLMSLIVPMARNFLELSEYAELSIWGLKMDY